MIRDCQLKTRAHTQIVKMFQCLFIMYILGTKFGAMLDQLTDRCGTMGLLVTLSYFYPNYMFWFQLSMAIDVACHWIYMQAWVIFRQFFTVLSIICFIYILRSTLQGKSSHKFVDPNENPIMRLYYQKSILTFMCCGNELFYSALYLLYFTNGPTSKCNLILIFHKIIWFWQSKLKYLHILQ